MAGGAKRVLATPDEMDDFQACAGVDDPVGPFCAFEDGAIIFQGHPGGLQPEGFQDIEDR